MVVEMVGQTRRARRRVKRKAREIAREEGSWWRRMSPTVWMRWREERKKGRVRRARRR